MLRCRYYENQYPEPDEVVMCNVTEISEIAVYVTLLEYDHIKVIIIESMFSFVICCTVDCYRFYCVLDPSYIILSYMITSNIFNFVPPHLLLSTQLYFYFYYYV